MRSRISDDEMVGELSSSAARVGSGRCVASPSRIACATEMVSASGMPTWATSNEE